MKVLNLYSGMGGNRLLWPDTVDVTAVEFNEEIAEYYKALYPNDKVIIGDAHEYLRLNYKKFDFIWSSPPCQTHSKMVKATRHDMSHQYPDMRLYEEILLLEEWYKGKYIVENVEPFYGAMREPQKIGRHLFWSNLNLLGINDVKRPKGFIQSSGVEGKKALLDWLGLPAPEKNIYYGKNRCNLQVFRNCVHPLLGKDIFKLAEQQFDLEEAL